MQQSCTRPSWIHRRLYFGAVGLLELAKFTPLVGALQGRIGPWSVAINVMLGLDAAASYARIDRRPGFRKVWLAAEVLDRALVSFGTVRESAACRFKCFAVGWSSSELRVLLILPPLTGLAGCACYNSLSISPHIHVLAVQQQTLTMSNFAKGSALDTKR